MTERRGELARAPRKHTSMLERYVERCDQVWTRLTPITGDQGRHIISGRLGRQLYITTTMTTDDENSALTRQPNEQVKGLVASKDVSSSSYTPARFDRPLHRCLPCAQKVDDSARTSPRADSIRIKQVITQHMHNFSSHERIPTTYISPSVRAWSRDLPRQDDTISILGIHLHLRTGIPGNILGSYPDLFIGVSVLGLHCFSSSALAWCG